MPQPPPPYPLAIVICDAIWRDPATQKRFILGCFSVLHAKEFPATHPLMGLYVSLTNGRGTVPFKARLIDADEEREPIWSVEMDIEFPDPRVVGELDAMLGNVTFPEPGEYRFQLFAYDEFIGERRLVVNLLPQVEQ